MNIERARNLKPGDTVHFPAYRGSPAGRGIVNRHNPDLSKATAYKSLDGVDFIWVSATATSLLKTSVWPSNRLE